MGAWDSSDDDEDADNDQLVRFNAAVFDISANNISISPRSRFSKQQQESEDEFTDTEEQEHKPLSLAPPIPQASAPAPSPLRRRLLLFVLCSMFTLFASWRLVDAMQMQMACSSAQICVVKSKLALEPDFFAVNSPCLSRLGLSPVEQAILFAIHRLDRPFTPMLALGDNNGNLLAAIFATQCDIQVITTTPSTLLLSRAALRPTATPLYSTCHKEAKFYTQRNHNNTLLAIPLGCLASKIQLVIIHTSNAREQLYQVEYLLDNGHVDKVRFCFVFPYGTTVQRPVLDRLTKFSNAHTAVSLRKRQGFIMVVTESSS